MNLTDPAIIASIISIPGGALSAYLAFKFQSKLRTNATSQDIATRALGAQFEGWNSLRVGLEQRIALLEANNASLWKQNEDLWAHNRKQDKALDECEEKNIAMIAKIDSQAKRIRYLEQRITEANGETE